MHQSIPLVAQALAEVMRKMQEFEDIRKIAWRKEWWATLRLLESQMDGLKFGFGSVNAPFTKILVEVQRVLKIVDPGKPPSEIKSPFIEQLLQQVVSLTNMGAALSKRRKLTKDELKKKARSDWAKGARARLLQKQKALGLPPPNSHAKVLTEVKQAQQTATAMRMEFSQDQSEKPAFSSRESGTYLVQRGGESASRTSIESTANSIYDSVGMPRTDLFSLRSFV